MSNGLESSFCCSGKSKIGTGGIVSESASSPSTGEGSKDDIKTKKTSVVMEPGMWYLVITS